MNEIISLADLFSTCTINIFVRCSSLQYQPLIDQYAHLPRHECVDRQPHLKLLSNPLRISFESVKTDMAGMRDDFEKRMTRIKEEHSAELLRIDSKVRKTLSVRDATILELKSRVVLAEEKKVNVERILEDLNLRLSGREK